MKNKINGIIVLGLIVITSYYFTKQLNYNKMKNVILSANNGYIAIGIICMLIFWMIEALLIYKLIKKISDRKKSFWLSVKTTLIGQYYSLITPFASGGQPAQLYTLKKNNVSVGNGTAVLVSKFLLFQISVTIYSLFLWVLRLGNLSKSLKMAKTFILTGLTINSVGLTLIVLLAFRPIILKGLLEKIVKILYKFKIIKNYEKSLEKLEKNLNDYKKGIYYLKSDYFYTFKMFFFSFLQLTIFFSITFFIYKSLGLSGDSILDIITLQALLYMAVSFIPIPGTIGASEFGFSILFISIFSSNLVPVALLLWRGISYYFGLIVCGLFTLYIYIKNNVLCIE